jgi:signal transduction histidine kinase
MVRVPVWTPQRVGRSLKPALERVSRLLRPIAEVRTYERILYLLLALPLGALEFSFLVTALSFGFGTAITLIGIPVLVATVWAWRWIAQLERRIIARLLGTEIPAPYRPDPPDTRWWKRLGARLADPATWKDLAFLLLQLPLGIVAFSATVSVIGLGVRLLLAPAFTGPAGDGDWIGWLDINSTAGAIAAVPVGALILVLGIPALGALGRLYGWFAGLLLGSNADPALTAHVHELEDARSRIIAAADSERRRIERDLHDGAQQRLVALALNLRMAEQRVDSGEPGAAELVRQAGEEANLALKELRDLARGIHPAILTNRGLPAALEDLASRATVPVEVVAKPDERLADPVEAAAYFVVSECLANIGKHAEATSATVAVRAADGYLTVEVTDDGRGGAALDGGSGIQGLVDRVGALSGELTVESPPGQGTRVEARIPLTEQAVEAAAASQRQTPRVVSSEEAERIQGARKRLLAFRLGSLGIVAAVLVAIWALTDPGLPWIAWPLLALGLIGGLDAWHVLSTPPLSEADLADEPDRSDALIRLTRRRGLRHNIGALVVLNVFIVGVWLAAHGTYFWPAWVMLGSAVAIAIKALPRGAARAPREALESTPR